MHLPKFDDGSFFGFFIQQVGNLHNIYNYAVLTFKEDSCMRLLKRKQSKVQIVGRKFLCPPFGLLFAPFIDVLDSQPPYYL